LKINDEDAKAQENQENRNMNVRNLKTVLFVGMTLLGAAVAKAQVPLGSSFTYQGQLQLDGSPVDGATDMRFGLYSADGTQVGSNIIFDGAPGNGAPIAVAEGLFNAQLDFGAGAFQDEALFLEISVRYPSGSGSYATLPRQPLFATPYAVQTRGIFVDESRNVGIGTTAPMTPLALRGNGGTKDVGITQNQVGGGSTMEFTTADGAGLQATRFLMRGGSDAADIEFYVGARGAESEAMHIEGASGFVGIGTSDPQFLLDVNGMLNATSISTGSLDISGALDVAGAFSADSLLADSGDIVAERGTQSLVTRRLELQGARTGASSAVAEIKFRNYDNQEGSEHEAAMISSYRTAVGSGDLRFSTGSAGSLTEALRIRDNGFVGIGMTNPGAPLGVAGSSSTVGRFVGSSTVGTWLGIENTSAGGLDWQIVSTGSDNGEGAGKLLFKASAGGPVTMTLDDTGMATVGVLQITGGSDIAEPFNVRGEAAVHPGMVVALDPDHIGELRVADAAYDRTVAGIISGANGVDPGLTLTQAGTVADGKHPVALTGRVWCFADADANGPIQVGDLLTTSSTPGHAMRVSDHDRASGAVLGKAMSSLASGRGYVLVLVSLQ
jgi:hypothetical protein